MKKVPKNIIATIFYFGIVSTAHAQLLKNIGKNLEKKAERVVEKAINTKNSSNNEVNSNSTKANTSSQNKGPFNNIPISNNSFVRGTELIFGDNFENETLNSMPKKWTSNGTGSIEKVNGFEGNWFKLYHFNTYKIKDLIKIPENFTLEFDLLTFAEHKNNINIDFGFDYQKGVNSHNFLAYKNPLNINISYKFDRITFTSNELGARKQSEINANMSYFTNDVLKIKVIVEGKQLQVFAKNYKIFDTEMVDPITKKYFYIGVENEKNLDKVFISNFQINKF